MFAEAPNQLWFLVMLFVVFVIFRLTSDFFDKRSVVVGALIGVAFYVAGVFGGMIFPNVFQIWTALKYVFFYYLGFAFRKDSENLFAKIPWWVYLVAFICLFSFNYFALAENENILSKLANIAVAPICCTFGCLATVLGFSKINFEKIENTKLFDFLNKHNFVIYLFHQQLIYVSISIFNHSVSTILLVLLNLLFAVTGSSLISICISKIPFIKKLFGYK